MYSLYCLPRHAARYSLARLSIHFIAFSTQSIRCISFQTTQLLPPPLRHFLKLKCPSAAPAAPVAQHHCQYHYQYHYVPSCSTTVSTVTQPGRPSHIATNIYRPSSQASPGHTNATTIHLSTTTAITLFTDQSVTAAIQRAAFDPSLSRVSFPEDPAAAASSETLPEAEVSICGLRSTHENDHIPRISSRANPLIFGPISRSAHES